MKKLITIVGPTASGKTSLAILLARKYNGEIISADSRQVYRGMDIGTGKASKKEQKKAKHWLLDVVSPNTDFNVFKFKKKAQKAIKDILRRKKIPIVCGGTGFWIDALVYGKNFPEIKPDKKLRKELDKKSASELHALLKKLDKRRADNIDKNNKVRLIRAIEIAKKIGHVPLVKKQAKYDLLQLGVKISKEDLHKNIEKRLKKRLKEGMLKEIQDLHRNKKVSWSRLENFGLEYFWVSKFLRGAIFKEEMKKNLAFDIKKYAKRQMTWFKKDKRIKWISNFREADKCLKKFLKN